MGDAEDFKVGLAVCTAETAAAALFRIDGHSAPAWVPKTQISADSEVWQRGQPKGWLVVSMWFARKKRWV